eukprot:CAMPEP_0197184054 /NCGR_PEP_ID=MMETSP1423-20130617/9110_1 /TAXON_ID=476441 /ORGANISM="Pseudo-nitzschia heimii, Strain UNC1101" /LENGTH=959 /DNA_ID=CAMNT_0042634773 /DNA_START=105 /DNA_END=2984 /DNA_ORIENTATION=-
MAGIVITDDNTRVRQRKVGRDPPPKGPGVIPVVTTSPSSKEYDSKKNSDTTFRHSGRKKFRSKRRSSTLTSRLKLKLRQTASPFVVGLVVIILGTIVACILVSSVIGYFSSSIEEGCNKSNIQGIPGNIYNWCHKNVRSDDVRSTISRKLSGTGKAVERAVKRVFSEDIHGAPKNAKQMLHIINTHPRLSQDIIAEDQDEICYADLNRLGTTMESPAAYHQPAIGPCHYDYPLTLKPRAGSYEDFIDFFFFRDSEEDKYTDKLICLNKCVDQVLVGANTKAKHGGHFKNEIVDEDRAHKYRQQQDARELTLDELGSDDKVIVDDIMLIEAARAGMTFVVEKLMIKYGLDPLYRQVLNDPSNSRNLNAIQEAIRGGYAEMVAILTSGNNDLVIDEYGRTVRDYVRMSGSPIRPVDAKNVLGIDVDEESHKLPKQKVHRNKHSGWSETSADPYDKRRCDFDVVDGDLSPEIFYRDYFITGRPLVLRAQVPQMELDMFRKERWYQSDKFNPDNTFRVGPTAYPELTGQQSCEEEMSINQLERGDVCKEMPDKPMVHAFHPRQGDFDELFPVFDGEILDERGGFRGVHRFFSHVQERGDAVWQVFFGGDGSGATYHWHEAAFNILYVGIKEWKIAPPMYRGTTGMSAQKVKTTLDEKISLTCIQQPGDVFFIPNYWGHSTINHGFTIGAAAILEDWYQTGGTTFRGEEWVDPEQALRESSEDESPPFLFVHINKTGGTSLISMFSDRCEDEYWGEEWYGDHGDYHRAFHATAHAYIEKYGREAWDRAYTFTVVRHPLARQVSNFFFLIGMGCDRENNKCEERMIPDVDLDTMSDEEKIEAFNVWIQKLYHKFPPGHPEHYRFGAAGHGNEIYSTFGASQTSWLVDTKGKVVVKEFYKLEELSHDVSHLAENIPCLKNGPLDMAKENKTSKYPNFMQFAKNEATKKIINEVFADDFKNFGYDPL